MINKSNHRSQACRFKILPAVFIWLISNAVLTALPVLESELIKPDEIYIGIPIILEVSVTVDVEHEVHHPVKDTIGIFSVLDIDKEILSAEQLRRKQSESEISDQSKQEIIYYTLAGFDTGEQRLPPLQFEIYDPQSDESETLSTPSYVITIQSVLPDTVDTIKDIAPPLRVGLTFWDYFIPIAILAVVIAFIIIVIRKMRRPIKDEVPELKEDPRPSYLIALELLNDLKKKKLLEQGEYIDYHYHLSLILRIFLELHYDFRAVEMTTGEIRNYLNTSLREESSSHERIKEGEKILEVLSYTDLVKFARHVPDINRSIQYTEWLEDYLRSFAADNTEKDVENSQGKE